MTDTSYHIAIWIGIGIGIGKIFSSVLGIKSIGKKWYRSTFNKQHLLQEELIAICSDKASRLAGRHNTSQFVNISIDQTK